MLWRVLQREIRRLLSDFRCGGGLILRVGNSSALQLGTSEYFYYVYLAKFPKIVLVSIFITSTWQNFRK
jgi:hypothetical protein